MIPSFSGSWLDNLFAYAASHNKECESLIKRSANLPVSIKVYGTLFDMDGVLVRTTHADERCWVR